MLHHRAAAQQLTLTALLSRNQKLKKAQATKSFVLSAGHYELDLVIPHHRAAAQRLADAAAAEGEQLTWRNLVWEDLQVSSSPGPPDNWAGVMPTR